MPGPRLEGRFSALLPVAPVSTSVPPHIGATPRSEGERRARKRILTPRDPSWRLRASEPSSGQS